MKKNIFGVIIIAILISIVTVNIVKETRAKKLEELAQEEFLLESATKEAHVDVASKGLTAGNEPPDFELETMDGQAVKLSDYKGKKVILNFWATWCPPCKAEMPHMQNYYNTNASEENVEIIAVNLTNAEKGLNKNEKISNFIKEYGLTFPIPLDEEGEIGNKYQTLTIPTTYMIDTNGLIHKKIVGPMDEEMIGKLVQEMK
ncbi:peroxiredoxin family protein [Lederbergia lenta]|uniref:peroxiredoxin family protein n=1 Tax=Lederbergia lenta TaxID=1467 RepID=UPI00203ABF8D|nr:redoxin domain-containing protein [Lederbergia lenta]MCM3113099.1 redoxin domain-containing protein [Lederbergia lenta]